MADAKIRPTNEPLCRKSGFRTRHLPFAAKITSDAVGKNGLNWKRLILPLRTNGGCENPPYATAAVSKQNAVGKLFRRRLHEPVKTNRTAPDLPAHTRPNTNQIPERSRPGRARNRARFRFRKATHTKPTSALGS